MRIAAFGSGGVGGYFGGRLAEAGEEVIFIARGEHLDAIRRHGLRVRSTAGDFTIEHAQATHDPSSVKPVDVVLLGVKAWQIADAAAAMRPLLGPDTCIVPLENGIDAPEQLIATLGAGPVMGGLCRILSRIVGPGVVEHFASEPYVEFGELDGRVSPRATALLEAFSRARGVRAAISPDIRVAMWMKFLLIGSWSALGAITRVPIGRMRATAESRRLMEQSVAELYAVAVASGVSMPNDSAARAMAFVDDLPPDGTASMQRDVMEGRPSELDAQVGAVVRLADRLGVDVPLHRFVYAALLPGELRVRGEGQPTASR